MRELSSSVWDDLSAGQGLFNFLSLSNISSLPWSSEVPASTSCSPASTGARWLIFAREHIPSLDKRSASHLSIVPSQSYLGILNQLFFVQQFYFLNLLFSTHSNIIDDESKQGLHSWRGDGARVGGSHLPGGRGEVCHQRRQIVIIGITNGKNGVRKNDWTLRQYVNVM